MLDGIKNQKLDATSKNEARLHETHKEFSFDKLAQKLNETSGGKGTLEVLDESASKPDQTVSNPKTAIVNLDYHKQLANLSGKFKYTRQFGNRPPVSVELDMTGSRPVIRSEITEDGIRASAETILAMGHKHVNILQPDEYTDEQRDLIERTFTKAGVTPLFDEPSAKKSVAIGDQPKAEEQLAITDRQGKLASERAATIDPAREELAL